MIVVIPGVCKSSPIAAMTPVPTITAVSAVTSMTTMNSVITMAAVAKREVRSVHANVWAVAGAV